MYCQEDIASDLQTFASGFVILALFSTFSQLPKMLFDNVIHVFTFSYIDFKLKAKLAQKLNSQNVIYLLKYSFSFYFFQITSLLS